MLDQYLRDCANKQFDWGGFNCGVLVAGWVRMVEPSAYADAVVNGFDIPTSRLAWVRAVKEHGGMMKWASKMLDREAIPITQAQVGDMVLISDAAYGAFGICNGRLCAAFTEQYGVQFLPTPTDGWAWPIARAT